MNEKIDIHKINLDARIEWTRTKNGLKIKGKIE